MWRKMRPKGIEMDGATTTSSKAPQTYKVRGSNKRTKQNQNSDRQHDLGICEIQFKFSLRSIGPKQLERGPRERKQTNAAHNQIGSEMSKLSRTWISHERGLKKTSVHGRSGSGNWKWFCSAISVWLTRLPSCHTDTVCTVLVPRQRAFAEEVDIKLAGQPSSGPFTCLSIRAE